MANLDETQSTSPSSFALNNVTINKSAVHPEQWTLPQEWNIEMREIYGNWKLDVQSQIRHLDKQLHTSLQKYPEQAQYSPGSGPLERESEATLRRHNSGKMQRGLKRS